MTSHPWVGFVIIPIFALANAGVEIADVDIGRPVFTAVFTGLVFGKPAGMIAASWLATRVRLVATKPADLSWSLLAAGALLTGISFTMSLYIARLAYTPVMLDAAEIGILSAAVVSATALLMVVWVTRRSILL